MHVTVKVRSWSEERKSEWTSEIVIIEGMTMVELKELMSHLGGYNNMETT